MEDYSCPKCFHTRVYKVRRKKVRCAQCKYEWDPNRQLPLYLAVTDWREILRWFLHGLSGKAISYETGLHRLRIYRALTKVREEMSKDIPEVFSGTVEIDETYIGGQWKNKRNKDKFQKAKRGRGTTKTPVFGILCRGGKVWAQVVADVEAKTLLPLIDNRVKPGSVICTDTWKSYTGIAAKGYVHRLVEHGKGQ